VSGVEIIMLDVLLVLTLVSTAALIWYGRPRITLKQPTFVIPVVVEEDDTDDKARMLDEIFGAIKRDEGDEDSPTVVMDPLTKKPRE
jgi:hypothetical protein